MQVKYYLKKSDTDRLSTLYVQITHNYEKVRFYFTNIKIDSAQWVQAKEEVKKSYEGYSELNQKLKTDKLRIIKLITKFGNENKDQYPDKETIKKLLHKEFRNVEIITQADKLKTFWGFVTNFINASINGVRKNSTGDSIAPSTIKCYVTMKNLLLGFEEHTGKKIQFESIDFEFYTDFTEYLQNKKLLKKNTISKHIRTLKTIMREALDSDLHTNIKFSSRRFSAPNELTTAMYLNESELNELFALDLSITPGLERVRDLFLIGCYTGLRFSDLKHVTKKNIIPDHENLNDFYLQIKQTKTKGIVMIPLHEMVVTILEKYNYELPKPISIQKSNSHLKEVCKKLPSLKKKESIEYTKGGKQVTENVEKYKLISSHTARRSFATNSYLKGHKTGDIMAVTGHKTESSFNRYIRVTPMEKARSFKLHEDKQKTGLRLAAS